MTIFSTLFSEMRSLILAENLYSSGKLAVLLYLLTRLGGLANTLSLISLGWVAAFVLPKVRILEIFRNSKTTFIRITIIF
jgi:hypothetical protein